MSDDITTTMGRTGNRIILGTTIAALGVGGFLLGGGSYVKVSGTVIMPEDNLSTLVITVQNTARDTIWHRHSSSKNFRFRVDDNDVYTARFEQPGSLAKEVVLDVQHATRPWDHEPKSIRFEVVLEPADTSLPVRYAHPVGNLAFTKRNRRMVVTRDYMKEFISADTSAQAPLEPMLP